MGTAGRAAVLLFAAVLMVASIPPMLDEDRSIVGFCSPGCLLQQDAAHSVAVTPTPVRHEWSTGPTREWLVLTPAAAVLVHVAAPDIPRAPPHA
jgi:hypothetical protein